MSYLLDAVREARELRDAADREWVRALRRASEAGHSLREIGEAAGLGKTGVRYYLNRPEREDETT